MDFKKIYMFLYSPKVSFAISKSASSTSLSKILKHKNIDCNPALYPQKERSNWIQQISIFLFTKSNQQLGSAEILLQHNVAIEKLHSELQSGRKIGSVHLLIFNFVHYVVILPQCNKSCWQNVISFAMPCKFVM